MGNYLEPDETPEQALIREIQEELHEHSCAKWLTCGALDSVCWLPADQGLVDKLKEDDGVWEVTT